MIGGLCRKNEERDFSANWIGCLYQMVKQAELWLLDEETLKSEVEWEEYFKWYIEKANKMKIAFNKYR